MWYGWGRNVLFSPDGIAWRSVELPGCSPQCTDKGANNEQVERATSNGEVVLLLGSYPTGADYKLQSFVWISSDGVNWQRSGPIGKARGFTNDLPVDVWPVPGGWELAIGYYNRRTNSGDRTQILGSPDGLNWHLEATVAGIGAVDGAADAQGRRVLSIVAWRVTAFGSPAEQLTLVTSSDGQSWEPLALPVKRDGSEMVVRSLFSPGDDDGRWVVQIEEYRRSGTSDESNLGSSLWLSSELHDWQSLVSSNLDEFIVYTAGSQLIARACDDIGIDCRTYLISLDESGWPEIQPQIAPSRWSLIGLASGPAGVLAVLDDGRVYQLR